MRLMSVVVRIGFFGRLPHCKKLPAGWGIEMQEVQARIATGGFQPLKSCNVKIHHKSVRKSRVSLTSAAWLRRWEPRVGVHTICPWHTSAVTCPLAFWASDMSAKARGGHALEFGTWPSPTSYWFLPNASGIISIYFLDGILTKVSVHQ